MSQDARAPREERIGVGGVGIFVRSWQPESGAPRALVVVCHGVNSHGGQYLSTGGQLAARGFAAWALDWRGRGRSDGARFHVDDVGTRFTVADQRGERTSLRSSAPHTAGRCALISGDGEVRLLTALYIDLILCP